MSDQLNRISEELTSIFLLNRQTPLGHRYRVCTPRVLISFSKNKIKYTYIRYVSPPPQWAKNRGRVVITSLLSLSQDVLWG